MKKLIKAIIILFLLILFLYTYLNLLIFKKTATNYGKYFVMFLLFQFMGLILYWYPNIFVIFAELNPEIKKNKLFYIKTAKYIGIILFTISCITFLIYILYLNKSSQLKDFIIKIL